MKLLKYSQPMKTPIIAIFLCWTSIAFSAELPPSIQAKIPIRADITWQSAHKPKEKCSSRMVVMYRLPVIGGNDSCSYLEVFLLNIDGSAESLDRIYFGGRGMYAIDKVTENENIITIQAREPGDRDCIANPTKKVTITVDYYSTPVLISKSYPE
jgi:hypothetical protein